MGKGDRKVLIDARPLRERGALLRPFLSRTGTPGGVREGGNHEKHV
jgi:hypothetical protein